MHYRQLIWYFKSFLPKIPNFSHIAFIHLNFFVSSVGL